MTAKASFVTARRLVFAIVLAGYVLSFFHRTAPAAIATELASAFAINAAVLGTLAATYFYVYTLLQVPVGVLADTMGPRRIVAVGSAIAGLGSLLFGLAPTWQLAAAGRTLVGVGVSVAFIAILKIIATWFPASRFATITGVTMLAGNLGAVVAGAPLAWLVSQASWRTVFVALGLVSLAIAIGAWAFVRDTPHELGFDDVNRAPAAIARVPWRAALATVLANPATWPGFFVNLGVGGSYLAFAGLWAVPWLQHAYGMSRVAAAQHASTLLIGVAFGSLAIGMLSDRLGSRARVMRLYVALYALSWLPLVLGLHASTAVSLAWFLLIGLLIPGFTLTWTVAKEVNRPEHSGIATAVVNLGIFLGAGILQPLVGWIVDRGREAGDVDAAWQRGIAAIAAAALFGAVTSLFVRERKHA
jgi:sugar phosphate permease